MSVAADTPSTSRRDPSMVDDDVRPSEASHSMNTLVSE